MLMTPMAMMRPRNGDNPPARRVSSASPSLSPLIRYSRTYASSSSHGVPTVSISMTSFFMFGPEGSCLNFQRIEQLPHRVRRLLERSLLLLGERDLDDLLNPVAAELHGDADVEVVEAVLAGQIRGARKDFAFVFQDRFDHLHRRGAGRVPRRGLEEIDDFRAAVAGARDDRVDALLRNELGDRDPGDG